MDEKPPKKANKGRSASILLSVNGQANTIKAWAQIINPEDPVKAEFVIRDRYQARKNGRALTDAQVVYGIHYTDATEQPVEMGLPQLVQVWAQEAVNIVMPQIEAHLSRRMAVYLSDTVRGIREQAGMAQVLGFAPKIQEGITYENFQPVLTPVRKAVQKQVNPLPSENPKDPIIQQAKDWLASQGIDDIVVGDSRRSALIRASIEASSIVGGVVSDGTISHVYHNSIQPMEEMLQAPAEAPKPSAAPTLPAKEPDWWEPYIKTCWLVKQIKADTRKPMRFMPDEYTPPLTPEEEAKLSSVTFTATFCQSDILHLGEVIHDGRWLQNQNEYLFLCHNPYILDNIGRNPHHKLFARFMKACLFDLTMKCVLGVHDFHTFNRAMQVYMACRLVGKLQPSWLGRPESTPSVFSLLDYMHEHKLSPQTMLCVDMDPVLAFTEYRNNKEKVAGNLNGLKTFAEANKKPFAEHTDGWAWLSVYERETMIDTNPLFLPTLPDEIVDDVMQSFNYVVNYGRNRAMWPMLDGLDEDNKDIQFKPPVPLPDLIPVTLYDDPSKSYDYSAFDGALILDDASYKHISLGVVDVDDSASEVQGLEQ